MLMVRVFVMETLERVIEVEADSIQDAVDEVQKMYDDREIVLGERDFAGYEIKPIAYAEWQAIE